MIIICILSSDVCNIQVGLLSPVIGKHTLVVEDEVASIFRREHIRGPYFLRREMVLGWHLTWDSLGKDSLETASSIRSA